MATIAFVPHPQRREAVDLAVSTAAWLDAHGHKVRVLADASCDWDCTRDELAQGLDLAISIGGDGTMLRTVDLVLGTGVPVLGVDVGHLGYLTEVTPEDLRGALARFLGGDYRIEERMTLRVDITRQSDQSTSVAAQRINALNDVVVQRITSGHTVRLAVTLNGDPFLTYAADSMIVATPTGSTAYNLSARGPIVSPRTRVLLMTPVAAHMLFDRTLILSAEEDVMLEVLDGRQSELVVDGQSQGFLTTGDIVRCGAGEFDARLVSFGGRDFQHILKRKFGLSDR